MSPAGQGGGELVADLKQAIRDAGVSLNELARRAGVSQGQLSRFVRGERNLSLESASKLMIALGLRVAPATTRRRK